jgi:HD superfamily phosphodiesterase
MTAELIPQIKQIETQWLAPCFNEVQSLFKDIHLPSHDQAHHRRVWEYAKELLCSYSGNCKGVCYHPSFIEALLFACFFHDTGLIQTFDESHGRISAGIAGTFLQERKLQENIYYNELIHAIILHDDKSYFNVDSSQTPGIYEYLTVADDLDAFGALGLMRYIEIYAYRGISRWEIKDKIRANLDSRFNFVAGFLSHIPDLFVKHKERYEKALYYLDTLGQKEINLLILLVLSGNFLSPMHISGHYPEIKMFLRVAGNEQDKLIDQ